MFHVISIELERQHSSEREASGRMFDPGWLTSLQQPHEHDKNDDNPEKDILEDNFKKLIVAWTSYKLFYETFEDSSSEECNSSENTNKNEMDSCNLDETEIFSGNLDETEMFSGNLDETEMFSGNLKEIEMDSGDLKETNESVCLCESPKDENCNT
ncbi:hypothetical protein AVEN_252773-1 [Araneus ventricosus]|uniref:Uncharacterized protein n=1 Tax=Araneus ventricosus TaxID=182803 RepID=A0A4Y2MIB1_ARAVE|nr:hypothetical protein AVEN_252773-1 [Araneus ventricosus]